MKPRPASLLLLLGVSAVSLILADLAFRFYESRAFTASYRLDGPVADLQGLNYNDTSVPRAKPPNELRILSFGDSFCHSIVRFPASYNGVAQELLSRPGRPARVVNLGEPSSSFLQYAASMRNWTPQIAHDAVIVNVFLGNDLSEAARREIPDDGVVNRTLGANFVDVQTGRKRMRHVPRKFPLRMMDFAYAYYLYFTEGQFVLRDVPEPYTHALGPMSEADWLRVAGRHLEACDPAALPLLEKGLGDVDALGAALAQARAGGTRVLVLLSPAQVQLDPALLARAAERLGRDPAGFDLEQPARLVRERLAASAPDAPVLDLTPALREAASHGAALYYPLETHWSVEGNRVAGQTVAKWVEENWADATR